MHDLLIWTVACGIALIAYWVAKNYISGKHLLTGRFHETAASSPIENKTDNYGNLFVYAPFAGAILKVPKANGDKTSKADTIATIEAMKMENDIHASKDGYVFYHKSKGDICEAGDLIAVISDYPYERTYGEMS